jgi:predicted choloylglycine hydrolase
MNEHGLCASLSYGGSDDTGKGFGVSLVLKYVLDFCKTTREAIEIFKRVPVSMAYNITLIDSINHVVTLELSPFEDPIVLARPFAVNQQGDFDLNNYAMFSNSQERQQTIKELLFDPLVSIESFVTAFSYSPLFSTDYDKNFGTLYTGIFNPFLRACEFRLPDGTIIYQSFENFIEQEFFIRLNNG